MAEVLDIQRAVMHPFPWPPFRQRPQQPVQQDRHSAFPPSQRVQHRGGCVAEQRPAERRDR